MPRAARRAGLLGLDKLEGGLAEVPAARVTWHWLSNDNTMRRFVYALTTKARKQRIGIHTQHSPSLQPQQRPAPFRRGTGPSTRRRARS